MSENEQKLTQAKIEMPSLERIQQELGSAKSIDDFFGKEGIFARLFATTLEQMLEAELTAHLGYEKYEAKGRGSGNSRNGKYKRQVRSSSGAVEGAVPRDRQGEFTPKLLHKYETSSNELEDKIICLYAKGLSVRDTDAWTACIPLSFGTPSTLTSNARGGSKRPPFTSSWRLTYKAAKMSSGIGSGMGRKGPNSGPTG